MKGRFFDRLDAKLNQVARFDSNELVSIDLQAMATALFLGTPPIAQTPARATVPFTDRWQNKAV